MNLKSFFENVLQIIKRITPPRLKYLTKTVIKTKNIRNEQAFIKNNNKEIKDIEKSLWQLSYDGPNYASMFIKEYLDKSVKPIKVLRLTLKENDPILLCAVKNDLDKVKMQIEYHRKIGIKHFAYIDNMSDDGTFEWLKGQDDVSLFSVDKIFKASVKNAWKRQVTDILGYDKWYLNLDSDELFIYPGVETKNINAYVDFLECKKIKSTLSPMIDMYSIGAIFGETYLNSRGIQNKYCYFDIDTYKMEKSHSKYLIAGGPRMRLFPKFSCLLTKYALVKLSKEVLLDTHGNYPHKYSFQTKGVIAFLLHYKFLLQDYNEYKKRAISGVMHGESAEYKYYINILEQNPNLSFYYAGSSKLNGSMDLMKINIVDKNFFKKFLSE